MVQAKKQTFLERVMNFINGGEEGNVKRVLTSVRTKWKRAIASKERLIDDIKRKLSVELEDQETYLSDAKTDLAETYLNISSDIKGKDDIDAYVNNTYEAKIVASRRAIKSINAKIEGLKDVAEKAITKLEKEIVNLTEDLAQISN